MMTILNSIQNTFNKLFNRQTHSPINLVDKDLRYKIAIAFLLSHEGGYSDHKTDEGGPTKYGISLRFLKNSGLDINGDGKIDIDDIRALNLQNAEQIYKEKFWDKYNFNAIKNIDVAKKIFDLAVNMGPQEAIIILQKAINSFRCHELCLDGVLEDATLAATNVFGALLLPPIKEEAAAYYKNLVKKFPYLQMYLTGWLKRAED